MRLGTQLLVLIALSLFSMDFAAGQTQPTQKTTTPSQEAESGDREIGKSYATLRPEQQRLVDDFIRRYNQATGRTCSGASVRQSKAIGANDV